MVSLKIHEDHDDHFLVPLNLVTVVPVVLQKTESMIPVKIHEDHDDHFWFL